MKIVENQNRFHIYNNITITDKLEPNIYSVAESMAGYFLQKEEDFKFPEKIYDVEKPFRDVVLTRFKNTDKNLGVLLSGTKGQGKSLTAKLLCVESGLPVIVINKSFDPDVFDFLRQIEQDFIVFVDEFEKLYPTGRVVYDENDNKAELSNKQNMWLPVMDGGVQFPAKVLFLFTVNESVSDYLLNRPSRIRYNKIYNKLDKLLFDEIIKDKLVNQDFAQDLEGCVSLENLNIDTLISIIEDVNMLNQPASTFMSFFNYKTDNINISVQVFTKDNKLVTTLLEKENVTFVSQLEQRCFNIDKNSRYRIDKLLKVEKGVHYFTGCLQKKSSDKDVYFRINDAKDQQLLFVVEEVYNNKNAF